MKTILDYKKDFLCVLTESDTSDGSSIRVWHPVRRAERTEIETLSGRPLTIINPTEGIYVDEEGHVFRLANRGETKPLEVEQLGAGQKSELEALLEASLMDRRRRRRTQMPPVRRARKMTAALA